MRQILIALLLLLACIAEGATLNNVNPSLDTYISTSDSTNHSAENSLTVSWTTSGSVIRRALLRFDLTAISGAVLISSATLRLYSTATASPGHIIYRLDNTAWTGPATWTTYDGSNSWTAGSPITDPTSNSISISGFSWNTWTVTDLVQDACSNRSKILNIVIKRQNETGADTSVSLYPSELGSTPDLDITYTLVGGGVPGGGLLITAYDYGL